MTQKELDQLLSLEKEYRGTHQDPSLISYEPFVESIYEDRLHGILTPQDCYVLMSYAGTTHRYINNNLRNRDKSEINGFVIEYERLLNKILDKIKTVNTPEVWRWHIYEDEYNFLLNKIEKTICFPSFLSTSLWKKPNAEYYFKIITSQSSKGKHISRHLNKNKYVEKEVLFKSNSTFCIMNSTNSSIVLKEININPHNVDIEAKNYYYS